MDDFLKDPQMDRYISEDPAETHTIRILDEYMYIRNLLNDLQNQHIRMLYVNFLIAVSLWFIFLYKLLFRF